MDESTLSGSARLLPPWAMIAILGPPYWTIHTVRAVKLDSEDNTDERRWQAAQPGESESQILAFVIFTPPDFATYTIHSKMPTLVQP